VDASYMVFGFQHAGKTTFAAALWHLVDSQEIATGLSKGKHTGNFTYLEEIAAAWAEGYEVERTKSQQVENISINLVHAESASDIGLEFDDLSGETFEKAFSTRYCPERLVELVKSARGMLLFISASRRNDDSVTILDAFDAEEDGQQPAADPAKWDPEKTPLQVQLVDLLQCLQRAPFSMAPMKIAVIVSAWDLAPEGSTDAARWLNDRYPLLSQYLLNSSGVIDVRVYGVSAQGGRLSKKSDGPGPDRERLLAIVPASKRIQIVGPDASEHDITRPLLWLAGLESSN
jgi:Double-GTPase 1